MDFVFRTSPAAERERVLELAERVGKIRTDPGRLDKRSVSARCAPATKSRPWASMSARRGESFAQLPGRHQGARSSHGDGAQRPHALSSCFEQISLETTQGVRPDTGSLRVVSHGPVLRPDLLEKL